LQWNWNFNPRKATKNAQSSGPYSPKCSEVSKNEYERAGTKTRIPANMETKHTTCCKHIFNEFYMILLIWNSFPSIVLLQKDEYVVLERTSLSACDSLERRKHGLEMCQNV
jgi:hypothetical protein